MFKNKKNKIFGIIILCLIGLWLISMNPWLFYSMFLGAFLSVISLMAMITSDNKFMDLDKKTDIPKEIFHTTTVYIIITMVIFFMTTILLYGLKI